MRRPRTRGANAAACAHRRRVSRHVWRGALRRGFDAPTFEEDEREIPLGGDDKAQGTSP